jgi:hypothetical protein
VPRSRNTSLRPKNTSRAEARRRHREEQRDAEDGDNAQDEAAQPEVEAAAPRMGIALPNLGEDLRALPRVFRKPLVWLPFGLLMLAFGLELARQNGAFPEGQLNDILTLYIQLTLPPTSLFVFFIGGFVAERASYLVGALLGIFDALLITILVMRDVAALEGSGVTEVAGEVSLQTLAPMWGIAILVGIFAAGFAAWYRRFLRSSQARAAANRASKERDQAQKAKEQARADKQAERDSRRNTK